MLIQIIASRTEIDKDIQYFKQINDIVKKLGHTPALDWIEPTIDLINKGEYDQAIRNVDWKKVNKENLEAMARAEVVIAEATARSFSTGFQVATAIQQKKPVLILTRNQSLGGTFGSGLTSDFVRTFDYTKGDLETAITDFLGENTIENKDLRFNFFIDRQIYNYLRWASFKSGKTKAEILRELVQKEINKEDF